MKGLLLFLAGLLLCSAGPGVGARIITQRPEVREDPSFANVVDPESTALFQQWQGAPNDTLLVFQADSVVHFSGARFVPFTREDQQAIAQAFRDVVFLKQGPAELVAYKETWPDPSAPEGARETAPGVDLTFRAYWIVNNTQDMTAAIVNATWEASGVAVLSNFLAWGGQVSGALPGTPLPKVLFISFNNAYLRGGYVLHPIIALDATLAVVLADSAGALTTAQASIVGAAVRDAVVSQQLGSLVEVVSHSQTDGKGRPLVGLEVTLYYCRDNATVPSPQCEQGVLAEVLRRVAASPDVQAQWRAAGVAGVEVVRTSQRLPPPQPNATAAVQQQPWVPWHLDRIDQRSLPLDGKFTATATGTGVNVYIISSGVLGTHEEFGSLAGGNVSRVRPAWGYLGANPLQDCPDAGIWYGYGTYAASLCCGLKLGPAKNATIHSVKFRERCMSNSIIWSAGGLPAALDLVLSTYVKPAVVLVDTWWGEVRGFANDASAAVKRALNDRLDLLAAANITIVAAAGPGFNYASACDNVFAQHPAVISVAASDTSDQAVHLGPTNSPCITFWAPSGGAGSGLLGASSLSPSGYTRIVSRSFGSAPIVAGVAAQYLELHPNATAAEVREALLALSTPGAVTEAGITPANLLFTNLTEPSHGGGAGQHQQPGGGTAAAGGSGGGGGLSTAAVVGIAVAAVAGVAAVAAAAFLLAARKRQRRMLSIGQLGIKPSPTGQLDGAGWEISLEEIEIFRHPDGSEWLLGEGQLGKVYKAIKGGVQDVAIRRLKLTDSRQRELLLKEVEALKHLSRDANITQFYGACFRGEEPMLAYELMEGGDLRSALAAEGGGREVLQWYRQGKDVVLDAVRGAHFLHSHNVVHLGITSRNILLARNGRAKLSDVGLTKLMALPGGSRGSSSEVLAWTAPEVLRGGGKCGTKADIYSLGVVLWELVTGEAPQRGRLRGPHVPEECPQGVADAIQACMQEDPRKRPSARELYSQLLSCPPSGNYQAAPSLGRSAELGGGEAAGVEAVEGSAQTFEGKTSKQSFGGDSRLKASTRATEDSSHQESREQDRGLGTSEDKLSNSSGELGSPVSSVDLALVMIDFGKIEFCRRPDGRKLRLGAGSLGKVYKVLLDGVQPLAAKSMRLGQDPALRATFLHEASMMWKLRHRNIVGLSGVSISEDKGYLLMELMEGGSLYKVLGAASRSSGKRMFAWEHRGWKVALDVAWGLHYLHSLRMTHFRVKSANILLSQELTAKLADAGLSRVLCNTHHSLGDPGNPAEDEGNPANSRADLAYMAPELMAGTKCTQAVDIYSFGVLLHEICTGVHPEPAGNRDLRVPEECPQEVADLYRQCTDPAPAARPRARELVERLSAIARVRYQS